VTGVFPLARGGRDADRDLRAVAASARIKARKCLAAALKKRSAIARKRGQPITARNLDELAAALLRANRMEVA
jgi:hypothetical protein